MPRSYSQKATAAIDSEMHARAGAHGRADAAGPASDARRRTLVFIVASPRPQVGKTFIARLLVDFLRLQGGEPEAFDLNPSGDALRDYLPDLAVASDVEDIHGQMALFDRLIVADGTPKVVDVGSASFERFFTITQQIRFIEGAQRRSIEPEGAWKSQPLRVAQRPLARPPTQSPHPMRRNSG